MRIPLSEFIPRPNITRQVPGYYSQAWCAFIVVPPLFRLGGAWPPPLFWPSCSKVKDVDRLSAQREQHSLKFAHSLPKCSRTSKLLPPCRSEIHGRQLRNNAKLTQPRARTNRYACSPIPYYVELLNSKLP